MEEKVVGRHYYTDDSQIGDTPDYESQHGVCQIDRLINGANE
jgi:hypothetical protein